MEHFISVRSALGTRTDAVHPIAGPLDALRDETTFYTNSKKSISLATRPPSSSNMDDTYSHALVQCFWAPDSGAHATGQSRGNAHSTSQSLPQKASCRSIVRLRLLSCEIGSESNLYRLRSAQNIVSLVQKCVTYMRLRFLAMLANFAKL
jgi:hypothetical protein